MNKNLKKNSLRFLLLGAALASPLLVTGCNKNSSNEEISKEDGELIKIGDKEFTKIEYNFFYQNFVDTFRSVFNDDSFNIDYSKSLDIQEYKDGKTWGDFFRESTNNMIAENIVLNKKAKEAKVDINTEELYKKYIESVEEAAKKELTTADAIMSGKYGQGATVAGLEKVIKDYLTGAEYKNRLVNDYKPTDSEIEKYYEENKNKIDVYDFRVLEIPYYGDLDYSEDNKLTESEKLKSKEGSIKKAEEIMSSIKTEEDFKNKYKEMYPHNSGEYGIVSEDGSLNKDISEWEMFNWRKEWLTDPARKTGDMTLLTPEPKEYPASEILYFINKHKPEQPLLSIRQIVLNTGIEPNKTEKDFKDKEEYEKYKKDLKEKQDLVKINTLEVLKAWKDGPKTEDQFIELFDKYSNYKDPNKGLFRYQAEENFIDIIREWAFAKDRKEGDMKAFATDYYTTVIYIKSIDGPIWKVNALYQMKKDYANNLFKEEIKELINK